MEKVTEGYVAFNGHIFTAHEADRYARITAEIERERYPATIEFLKDQRHRMFCQIIGVIGY